MMISYDKKADAANITFQRGKYHLSQEAEGIIVDYTKDGKILRIEILDVSKRMPGKSLKRVNGLNLFKA